MTKIQVFIHIVLYVMILVSCGTRVDFLTHVDFESPELAAGGTAKGCLTIEGGGDVCVEQKEEIIRIKDTTNHPLEMIFVSDLSQSMISDLSRLGRAFKPLISQVEATDWRMMFTTAYHGDHTFEENLDTGKKTFTNENWWNYAGDMPYFGQLMYLKYNEHNLGIKVLSKAVGSYEEIFQDTLDIDPYRDFGCSEEFCPVDIEQPLRVLIASFHRLSRPARSPFAPRIRKNSDVIVFISTDEDERVEDPTNATRAEEVIKTFQTLFPGQKLYAFAFLVNSRDCYTQQVKQKRPVAYGRRVSILTSLTHGKSFSICDPDYGDSMEAFSSLLKARLQGEELEQDPFLPEKLEVNFPANVNPTDWDVIGKELIFKDPLPPGTKLKITYFVKKQMITKI